MRTFLTSAFFYALLPACSGQPPTVENLRILSGDQLALLRTVIQQNFPDNEIAKSDTELRLRLCQFQTATILFDKSAATGSKYWYSDRNSSLPTARDFVDATDHQNLIDYAASGLHKRGFSVSGGVVMELRNESRTVTETILKPVTETVSRTIQTPNGPRVVHEKVTKYVEEKVQKTITVSVPVEKFVAPPTAELKALLDELNRTANPSVKKTLERIVGAKFAEQYPVGKTIPGAESAVVLADKYRLAEALDQAGQRDEAELTFAAFERAATFGL